MVFTKSSSSKSPTKRLNQPRGRSSGWGRTKIHRVNHTKANPEKSKNIVEIVETSYNHIPHQKLPSSDTWNHKMYTIHH